MSARSPVWLVTTREYRLRVRSKAFVVSTLVIMAAVAAMIVLTAVAQDDDDRRRLDVGVVEASGALSQQLVDVGDQLDTDVRVERLTSAAAAEQAVLDGDVNVPTIGDELVWESDAGSVDSAIVRSALQSAVTIERADDLAIAPSTLRELLAPVAAQDRFLDPEDGDRSIRIATATVGVVLLFIAIQSYGNLVLQGVVEEKSSRVVEVLLNHVRPRQLLAGKVLGLGALGLTQMVLILVSVLGAMFAVRGIDVPNVPADALLWFGVWFLLGFGLYATAFAMGGSLVSRQEDAASVVTPISIPFIGSYFASFAIASVPDSVFARVLSIVPVTAPMAMPVRLAAGDPPWVDVAASLVLTVGSIYLLVRVAGRVYSRNVLRTGARVSWGAALRAARAGD